MTVSPAAEAAESVAHDAVPAAVPEVYRRLGIRPIINASATLTRLGGSVMPEVAVKAMAEASQHFIPLDELQLRVGERIADLTGNEACYVSSGAAAGIAMSVAACIAGTDLNLIGAFPYLDGVTKNEVIIHVSQRNGYDYAARQTGARVVEIGGTAGDLRAAIGERTACILWFAGAHFADGALPLEEVIAIGHEHGVPVIVDAAAQVPAIANLSHYTVGLGADLAIFSGGKGLRGPQSSGLVLGRADLVAGCRLNGSPNHSLGRPMKVGKEEMVGLLAAVEYALEQDEPALLEGYEAIVQRWVAGLSGFAGITAERIYPSEAGQPHGRALITVSPGFPLTRDAIVAELFTGEPRIAVAAVGPDGIALNPQTIQPGEDEIVLARLREVLSTAG
ncbi:MAG: L-seryl-tRNA(Sec) selenium transferase-related protein [uncultured Thermomicrobiales bacterium]|uniref:L-seryl-tRNA(Sec) selenium transferase-related protein n=1 Tax=uncultured Thermomicrobiales bacterium TaxID=1645740 RepID=A0A6J4V0E6_9BACT|nr:MAG: L-seryl-tRNA(Sec) selenium transferase-related protein [uncultured Thermomicrobiales bacterium]